MNRYSLFFTLLVATSFAVHPARTRDAIESAKSENVFAAQMAHANGKSTYSDQTTSLAQARNSFLRTFLDKARIVPGNAPNLQILFVTAPHPTETNLALAFDHTVDALQDGLQEAGYLFDSAWIPWTVKEQRGSFDDDEKEKIAHAQSDMSPGILTFRNSGSPTDYYTHGMIAFLICEKPTEGIALAQVSSALDVLKDNGIALPGPIRILGPSFSGSLASLIPTVHLLHGSKGNPLAEVWIRSGGISGGLDSIAAVGEIARESPDIKIHFGSTRYDNPVWIQTATCALRRIGIESNVVAMLSEGESAYGHSIKNIVGAHDYKGEQEREPDCSGDSRNAIAGPQPAGANRNEQGGPWNLSFPRDISKLRAEYEKQGILNAGSPKQAWPPILDLKSEGQGVGDSVRAFGGAGTVASQEAILFGLSEFIKIHEIRAVIVSATNEEDRYFLAQFLHAHNSGIRVVVVGTTRLFMRGSTAQFRGDMIVDTFPMIPRLHDWTAPRDNRMAHVFADSEAEGVYFATLDLFKDIPCSVQSPSEHGTEPPCSDRSFEWFPEYNTPNWDAHIAPARRPPMYVAALGSNAIWPVTESHGEQLVMSGSDAIHLEMPFTLFGNRPAIDVQDPPPVRRFPVGRSWKDLFAAIFALTLVYCSLFWCSNPVSGVVLTSFEPSRDWRFWLFKVTLPAFLAGCAFWILALAVEIPSIASSNAVGWWRAAGVMSALAPAGIALAAATKAVFKARLGRNVAGLEDKQSTRDLREMRIWYIWMSVSFLPTLAFIAYVCFEGIYRTDPFAGLDVGSILNAYREMHAESGLSLVPTGMMFLLAILMWASQAGNGAALFEAAPRLPDFHGKPRISQARADIIASIGRPLPFSGNARWLWTIWVIFAAVIILVHYNAHPFVEITTLESFSTTCIVRGTAGVIATLILLDLLQFFGLWSELQGLLRALDRETFRRSFNPIQDFSWKHLWSFTGISLQDRRAILASQIRCVLDFANSRNDNQKGEFDKTVRDAVKVLQDLVGKYNRTNLSQITSRQYRHDLGMVYETLALVGTEAALVIQANDQAEVKPSVVSRMEAFQRTLALQRGQDKNRFNDEAEALANLPKHIQAAERLVCLIYIGFVQTVIARLHTLLVSVASMFSLVTLGIAIYPFVPFMPLLLAGVALLVLIGWAFFKIFSEMDTDPILSRIVNGDDQKLQGNFYMKFAEAIALPILTLGSSLLPGGSGRLLEFAQTLLSQGQ